MLEGNANNELHTQIQYRLIEKLTESERRYRELVENLREIVFECDRQGCVTFVNKAWTETLGYAVSDVVGKRLDGFIDSTDVEVWQSLLEHQADCCVELRFCHQDGDIRWLELSIRCDRHVNFFGSLIDITERKQSETILKQTNEDLEVRVQQRTSELTKANQELAVMLQRLQQAQGQLIQQEKMSGLGQLVAGIAHEINNPVNFIHGNIPHIQQYVQDLLGLMHKYQQHYPHPVADIQVEAETIDLDFIQKDLPKTLSSMEMGSNRIREIVKSLRNFSRLDEADIKSVDIHDGLDNTLIILNHRLKAHADKVKIHVIKDYATLPTVECYAGLLNQVFMNILANAIDALEEQSQQTLPPIGIDNPSQITLRTSLINDQWIQIEIAEMALEFLPIFRNTFSSRFSPQNVLATAQEWDYLSAIKLSLNDMVEP